MPKCESCGVDAAEIKAQVQTAMETRISEQGARIKEMRTLLEETTTRATSAEAKVKEMSAREEAVSLREAEQAGGWTLDERGRKLARWAYDDAHEAVDVAERPTFADWLKSETAASDPVLSTYRQGATGVAPPATGKAPAPGARPPTPPPNGSVQPPVRRTLDQINAEVRTVMSSGISPAEKSSKLAELKSQRDQASKAPVA